MQFLTIHALLPVVAGAAMGAGQSPGWAGNLPAIEQAVAAYLARHRPGPRKPRIFYTAPQSAFLDLEQCCATYRAAVTTNIAALMGSTGAVNLLGFFSNYRTFIRHPNSYPPRREVG